MRTDPFRRPALSVPDIENDHHQRRVLQAGLKTYEWEFIAMVCQSDATDERVGRQRLISPEEQEANARLIAAAPKMLEALQAVERHNDNPARYDSFVNRIVTEAIADATMPAEAARTAKGTSDE